MINKRHIVWIWTLLSFTFVQETAAQLTVTLQNQRDTIYLGDTLSIGIDLLTDDPKTIFSIDLSPFDSIFTLEQIQATQKDTSLDWTSIYQSAAQFEVLDYGLWEQPLGDTKHFSKNSLNWIQTHGQKRTKLHNSIIVTFWAPGNYILPYPKVQHSLRGHIKTHAPSGAGLKITVIAPTPQEVSSIDTLTQLTPIKPLIREQRYWNDNLLLVSLLGLFIVSILTYITYKIIKRKPIKPTTQEPQIVLAPHELALHKLQRIKAKKQWQQAQGVKPFQTELTHTLREYLEKRYQINALELTTSQILTQLEHYNLEKHHRFLSETLQVADLVKFGKAEPAENFHIRKVDEVIDFVKQTIQIEPTDIEA